MADIIHMRSNIGKNHLSLNKSWINNFSFYWHFCNEPCFPELFYREIWTEAIDLVVSIPRPWKMCNKFDIDNTNCPFTRICLKYLLNMLSNFVLPLQPPDSQVPFLENLDLPTHLSLIAGLSLPSFGLGLNWSLAGGVQNFLSETYVT